MTDPNFTQIVVVVDKSGSMRPHRNDAIGGLQEFIAEQKKLPGRAKLTMVLFDTDYKVLHDNADIQSVEFKDSDYVPSGGTALLDAIGKTIDSTGVHLAKLQEHERPGQIVFVILTDGEENSSKTYTEHGQVRAMIKLQEETYKWRFIYLAANADAMREADKLAFVKDRVANYAEVHTSGGIRGMSCAVSQYRTGASDAQVAKSLRDNMHK